VYALPVYALPTATYGRNVGRITQQYSRRELDGWLADTGVELADLERWRVWTGEH